ncbi:MAG: DUF305 domain-containing protein [Pseudomonadota bacterium]
MHFTLPRINRSALAASLTTATALLCWSAVPTQAQSRDPRAAAAPTVPAPGASALHQATTSHLDRMKGMRPSGDTDKDFALLMKAHHQHGIEMAQAEIGQGKSPELKAMASKLIAEQQKQIEQLDQWLAAYK